MMELPAKYRDLFDRVLSHWPGAMIAGGAVRDALLDRPIADIDVWVPNWASGPWQDVDFGEQESAPEYEMQSSNIVVTGAGPWPFNPFEPPVQVMPIGRRDYERHISLAELVARFDYDICMAAWSQEYGLYLDPKFLSAVQNKKITLIQPTFTSQKRKAKMRAKFPEWEIVD